MLAPYDWQKIPTGVTNTVYVPPEAGRWAHVLSDHAIELLLKMPPLPISDLRPPTSP